MAIVSNIVCILNSIHNMVMSCHSNSSSLFGFYSSVSTIVVVVVIVVVVIVVVVTVVAVAAVVAVSVCSVGSRPHIRHYKMVLTAVF